MTNLPGMADRLELVPIDSIEADTRNPKTHPAEQIAMIAQSIRTAGFCAPILVRGGVIVAGHGRHEAAKLIGLDFVPVVPLEHLDDEQVAFLLAADNELGSERHAPYDPELLALLLAEVDASALELEGTGFTGLDLENLSASIAPPPPAATPTPKRDRTSPAKSSPIHGLKIWPEHYQAMVEGSKSFELRRNDRGFAVGDRLQLREWDPVGEEFTGREIWRKVTHMLTASEFPEALSPDFVILSVEASRGK